MGVPTILQCVHYSGETFSGRRLYQSLCARKINEMQKSIFLQILSYFTAGIIVVTLFLNKSFFNSYFPHQIRVDFHFLFLSIAFSLILTSTMYLVIKYDTLIIPGILSKLRSNIKELILKITTIEVVYISFLAGFSEELLFRGFLQPLIGIAFTSILFGVAHFITLGYFILATAIGFFLGGAFNYSSNILVPIMVHSLYNIFAFKLLAKIFINEETTT